MPAVSMGRPPWSFALALAMGQLPAHVGRELLTLIMGIPEEQRLQTIEIWFDAFGPTDHGFSPAGPDTIGGLVDALEAKR